MSEERTRAAQAAWDIVAEANEANRGIGPNAAAEAGYRLALQHAAARLGELHPEYTSPTIVRQIERMGDEEVRDG